MSVLKEYLAFFDKVDKRVRDERVTELLAKLDLSKHGDFEGDKKTPPAKLVKLEKQLKGLAKDRGFKSVELQFDDEHNLWQAVFVNAHGVAHTIHWELASSAEYRQMMTKFKLIEDYMEPPFVIEAVARPSASEKDAEGDESEAVDGEEKSDKKNVKTAAKRKVEVEIVEKTNARDLFEYVKKAGTRGYDVQRYKGLGEMTAPQLWETTMDPERRTLLLVRLEDIAECETIFTTLMGEDVEARRKFIEENALDVKNLDI
jgi:DNA gyrase subunit B